MNLITLIPFLILSLFSNQFLNVPVSEAQNHVVYKQKLGEELDDTGVLVLTGNKSIYFFNRSFTNESIYEPKKFDEDFQSFDIRDDEGFSFYIDFKTKELVSRTFLVFSEEFIVLKEELPDLEWRILSDKKTIGSFEAKKAETEFRGRKFTAWFTEDIPIPAGPWKLQGLPGLILEAHDDQYLFTFEMEKVAFPSDVNIDLKEPKKGKVIKGWDSYCSYVKKKARNYQKYIQSKGAGYKFEIDLTGGLEIIQ